MHDESEDLTGRALIARAAQGDERALGELFDAYRPRLRRMVQVRLDHRLRNRVDPSDVLQETFIDVAQAAGDYFRAQRISFFLWLRLMTGRRLMNTHRRFLGTKMRDVAREISLHRGPLPGATSESIAAILMGRATSASKAAIRAEVQVRIQEALNGMNPIDREILSLRHLEELSNSEVAQELNISPTAASNRYVRALTRLNDALADLRDFVS